jgi:phosphoribosylaminoimidazolecarboxamide formyltransferase/IMP cyclohydrolase
VVKHNNPCGVAIGDALPVAAERALAGDPLSAFGSILGCNRELDAATAEVLARPNQFIEAVLAPGFSPQAFEILTTKPKWKVSVRLMAIGNMAQPVGRQTAREIDGGILLQEDDTQTDDASTWQVVTDAHPTGPQRLDLEFAWHIVRYVRSNAIAIAHGGALCGAGAGQMSRVDAVQLALAKSGAHASGAVLASDAFFPFADSIELAAAAGIAAIIQPGGSRNDSEVIQACNSHGLCMLFTGTRHFLH